MTQVGQDAFAYRRDKRTDRQMYAYGGLMDGHGSVVAVQQHMTAPTDLVCRHVE